MTKAFDRIIASADGAMVVVTAAADGEPSGCLVGFHAQCSIEPARYGVWLSVENHTHAVALAAERVAVHFLTAADHDLAEHFGGLTGDDVDKFADVDCTDGGDGLPLIDALPNRLVGRVVARLEGVGDHTLLVLDVESAACAEAFDPLRFTAARDVDPGHDA